MAYGAGARRSRGRMRDGLITKKQNCAMDFSFSLMRNGIDFSSTRGKQVAAIYESRIFREIALQHIFVFGFYFPCNKKE
jgi:hypothetical protein